MRGELATLSHEVPVTGDFGGAGLVTVVMPAFNVEGFIGEAILSVLAQTYRDFELIVVDDGSTDSTAERVAAIGDIRVRLLRQQNRGSSAARNAGIRLGSGRYIAFIDGDDVWLPGKLEAHIRFLESSPDADLTFAWSRVVDESGMDTGRKSEPVRGVVSFEQLFVRNVVGNGSTVVLRRDALDRAGMFDEQLAAAVEHDVWLRVALLRDGNVHCLPTVLSLYRMRAGQITKDWRRMEMAWRRMSAKLHAAAPQRVAGLMDEARCRLYRYLAYIAYETSEYRASATLLRRSLAAAPRVFVTDRGAWLVAGGLVVHRLLPRRLHRSADVLARRARAWATSRHRWPAT